MRAVPAVSVEAVSGKVDPDSCGPSVFGAMLGSANRAMPYWVVPFTFGN